MSSDKSWTLSWNLCDLPASYIGSLAFNEQPERFELQTVAHTAGDLFRYLDTFSDACARTEAFNTYVSSKFHLHELEGDHTKNAKRSLRNTYVRYLRGWGVDSNSIEGAVLKAWVESRIGLRPTYHRGKVPSETEEGQLAFAIDRMKGMAGSNAINSQLDLVYAYCQYELAKAYPGQTWLSLYRGTHDPNDYQTLEVLSPRERIVRLNNLSSFTPDAERAFEFGSTVWAMLVPLVKIFFHSQLFPQSILKGEDEFLVIGGIYRVKTVL
jgi:NAD+--dinitrogen-reductase ADP-D-ribosyltransferase